MSNITEFTEVIDGLEPDDVIYAGRPTDTGDADKNTELRNMFLKGLHLNADRIAMQEKITSALTVSDWHSIATIDPTDNRGASADFEVSANGGSRVSNMSFHVNFNGGASTKDFETNTLEITGKSRFGATSQIPILGVRLAKSDSVGNAGAKIEVQLDILSSIELIVLLKGNSATHSASSGISLITAEQSDGFCADDITTATFLEAGAELSFNNAYPSVLMQGKKASNDIIRVSVNMNQVPKQGNNVVLTLPSTELRLVDGEGVTVTISGAHAISNFIVNGNTVEFQINETGVFTTLNDGMVLFQWVGTGGKLTIT